METVNLHTIYRVTLILTWLCFAIGVYIHQEIRSGKARCKWDGFLYKSLLLLPLIIWSGYGRYSIVVADNLQAARVKSTPVNQELQYVAESVSVDLQSGRRLTFTRTLPGTDERSRCSDLRSGESRSSFERPNLRPAGLSEEPWVIGERNKL